MRIAYFVASFPIISETFVLNQITGIMDRGHEVVIFSWSRHDFEKIHSIVEKYGLLNHTYYLDDLPKNKFLRALKFTVLFLENILKLRFRVVHLAINSIRFRKIAASLGMPSLTTFNAGILLLKNNPEIIHCQFGSLGPRGLFLKRLCGLNSKLVTSFRGADATKFIQKKPGFYDELFTNGDLFLPVSHSLEQRLIEIGCDKNKIKILHSGIDCTLFNYSPRRLNTDKIAHILTIARLVEKKGVYYGIRAIEKLISDNYRIQYNIVGDGELRLELQQLIRDLGLDKYVHIIGWKNHDEIFQLLSDAHILLAPSITAKDGDQEGIPNVIKEAMALGIPVVSTYHSGIPELVQDGISGFLVPERDTTALADRLAYLVDHPEIWPEMGEAGRKFIEDNFNNEKLNDLLIDLYNSKI